MTGGMDNPVDVAFTPGGERMLHHHVPRASAAGRRDGLIHAIYGGVYGKPHAVIDDHKRTGDLMPVLTHSGRPRRPGSRGMSRACFGDGVSRQLLRRAVQPAQGHAARPEPSGATFIAAAILDFVVSDSRDFHPTDVLEDADGSLLVVDTGGWYKLCCPTSQLAKPEVLGAIYRVRRQGAPRLDDPRGRELAWRTMPPPESGRDCSTMSGRPWRIEPFRSSRRAGAPRCRRSTTC